MRDINRGELALLDHLSRDPHGGITGRTAQPAGAGQIKTAMPSCPDPRTGANRSRRVPIAWAV